MPRANYLSSPAYMLLFLLLLPSGSWSQAVHESPTPLFIPDGTPVKLQMIRTISSAHSQKDDRLDFVVVKDVTVDGLTIIQAGAIASGSVVAVKGKRLLGIGGKVVIKLESVELITGDEVALRQHGGSWAFRAGESRSRRSTRYRRGLRQYTPHLRDRDSRLWPLETLNSKRQEFQRECNAAWFNFRTGLLLPRHSCHLRNAGRDVASRRVETGPRCLQGQWRPGYRLPYSSQQIVQQPAPIAAHIPGCDDTMAAQTLAAHSQQTPLRTITNSMTRVYDF